MSQPFCPFPIKSPAIIITGFFIPCVSSSVAVDVVVVILVVVGVAAFLVVNVVDTGLVAGVLHLKLQELEKILKEAEENKIGNGTKLEMIWNEDRKNFF